MTSVFEAADLESAEHLLSVGYGQMRISARGRRHGLYMSQAFLTPLVRLDHLRFQMSVDVDATPLDALVIGMVRSGRVTHNSDGSQRRRQAGEIYLTAQPGHSYTGTIQDTESELAIIDPALLSRVVDPGPGRRQPPVRLTGYAPVSDLAAAAWERTYAFVRDSMLTEPDLPRQPLVMASAAQLLAAAALSTFPSTALTEPTDQDRRDSHHGSLRRAVTFIDEHADQDIAIADVAAAAQVTIRAVQLAFRRHLETTPMDYLRQVRLGRAHLDLVAAGDGHETVRAVALRWGFSSPGRFAAVYRRAYGVPPSRTLHS